MSDTTLPPFARIEQGGLPPDPLISVGDIKVEGNVQGSIVVGNHNVIGNNNVIYQIHDNYGAIVNWHPEPVTPRLIKPQSPREPAEFLGREAEQNDLRASIQNKRPVLLYGHDGLGKTALVKKVANSLEAQALPDGVYYAEQSYEGNKWELQDILQSLFDKLFESDPRLKASDAVAELYLQNASPLIILDQMGLSSASLTKLSDIFRNAAILVTDRSAPFDDAFKSIELMPLTHEDAIQLFLQKSGLDPDTSTRQVMDQICSLLDDVPLAISLLANAIRQKRLSLATINNGLSKIQPPSQNNIQAAIERSFGLLYSKLSQKERDMLALTAAIPGDSIDGDWLEQQAGGEEVRGALYSLELLYTHSPRLSVPDGMKPVIRSLTKDVRAPREKLLGYLLEQLKSRSQDGVFIADEAGNILGLLQWAFAEQRWSDVITLGKAVDPFLTIAGVWDIWGMVLNQVLAAADQVKDLTTRGWALHQLGTREIGVGTLNQAIHLLRRALRVRVSQGDFIGAAYTLHNLLLIWPPNLKKPDKTPKGPEDWNHLIRQLYSDKISWWQWLWESLKQAPGKGLDTLFGVSSAAIASVFLRPSSTSLWKRSWTSLIKGGWASSGTVMGVGLAVIAGVLARPSLIVRTQADPMVYSPVGQAIEYSYLVENPGLLRFAGPIVVIDDKRQVLCPDLTSIGNHNGFLDRNERMICTGFYTITEEDVANGSVTDIAQVAARDEKDHKIEARAKAVTIRYAPQYLKLSVEADHKTYKNADETIAYTFTAANLGKAALQGPFKITNDHKNLQVNCPAVNATDNATGVLNVGESFTCTATYTVTEGDVRNGSITARALASVGSLNSGRQSITIYREAASGARPSEGRQGAGQSPVLILSKSSNPKIYTDIRQEIKYSYSVSMDGTGYVSAPVTVSDDHVKVNCPDLQQIGNHDNRLDPGETLNCDATYLITRTDINHGVVTNTAAASAGGMSSTPQSVTIYYQTAPPYLRKSANPATYEKAGQQIQYTYSVMNNGKAPLPGPVTVSDDRLKVTCQNLQEVGNRDIALDPGEVLTCTATYVVTDTDLKIGSVSNTAWATVGRLTSNLQSVTIYGSALPPPILSLTKSANPETYQKAGDAIAYTYYIQNIGRGPLKGPVTVSDDRTTVDCQNLDAIGNQDFVFDPGEVLTCTSTYMITEADMQTGSVTNIASASMNGVTSNRDAVTVNAKALLLSISADPPTYQAANKPIQYTYAITSKSRQPLSGPVTVTDDKVQVACEELNKVGNHDNFLDWNETVTCQGQYAVTQADMDHGSITNTAWASAGDVNSDQVPFTSKAVPQPALTLTKSANPPTYNMVDQDITYTYVIENTGNVTLSAPFTITDDHIQNGKSFRCETNLQQLGPSESVTCTNTASYTTSQSDFNFGNSSVTNQASASSSFLGTPVTSDAVSTTVTCKYPPQGWTPYTVEDRETFTHISTWYPSFTMADLQKANCMGALTDIGVGQTLYVPAPVPDIRITGHIHDTQNRPLYNVPVTLINDNGIVVATTYTDANGAYEFSSHDFSNLKPGYYRIFQVRLFLDRSDNAPQDFEIRPLTR